MNLEYFSWGFIIFTIENCNLEEHFVTFISKNIREKASKHERNHLKCVLLKSSTRYNYNALQYFNT